MNTPWLLEHAGGPARYILTKDPAHVDGLLANEEVQLWLGRLAGRAQRGDLSAIHGGHDYRYENIVGKCFILGLNASIPAFDAPMRFFLDFLQRHIATAPGGGLTFGKLYHFRDYETLLACYLPFLGYAHHPAVQHVAQKRADIIYAFTRQNRYNVYRAGLPYPGVKREWKPWILDPALYGDGNIAFPSIHDFILFAGMYPWFDDKTRDKVETTAGWIFGGGYAGINDTLYYYAPDDPAYKAKGINSKVRLHGFHSPAPKDMQSLLYQCFILSHFAAARQSGWFADALSYLNRYKTESGRYVFPREMIAEQKDSAVTGGGHMNVGECKRSARYAEVVSTLWMERIFAAGTAPPLCGRGVP